MSTAKKEFKRDEVIQIVNSLIGKLGQKPAYPMDKARDELKNLSDALQSMRSELASLSETPIKRSEIQTATDELDAVVQATEAASGDIMDSCERIQDVIEDIDDNKQQVVIGELTNIYQACSFQDITGQRISKVITVVKTIEERLDALLKEYDHEDQEEAASKQSAVSSDQDLMNGPQLPDQGISQEEIDKLLDAF